MRIGDSREVTVPSGRPPDRPRPPVLPAEYDQDDGEASRQRLLDHHLSLGHEAYIEPVHLRMICSCGVT